MLPQLNSLNPSNAPNLFRFYDQVRSYSNSLNLIMQESGTSVTNPVTADLNPLLSQHSSSYATLQPRKTTRSKTANYSSLATHRTKGDLLDHPLYQSRISTRKLAQKHLAENSLLLPNQDPSLPDLVMHQQIPKNVPEQDSLS